MVETNKQEYTHNTGENKETYTTHYSTIQQNTWTTRVQQEVLDCEVTYLYGSIHDM